MGGTGTLDFRSPFKPPTATLLYSQLLCPASDLSLLQHFRRRCPQQTGCATPARQGRQTASRTIPEQLAGWCLSRLFCSKRFRSIEHAASMTMTISQFTLWKADEVLRRSRKRGVWARPQPLPFRAAL